MPQTEFKLQSPTVNLAKTISHPEQVDLRLRELSPALSRVLLHEVILSGLGARNEATRASPLTAAGIQQWLKTVEALRTRLSESDWRIHDQSNCPFITAPDGSLSLVVMTGNSNTGRQGDEDPSNQAEKGAIIEGCVGANRQLELFNQGFFKIIREKRTETQVWVLLYHYDKKLNEVRFEVSYPTDFLKKKIVAWGERIILDSIPNSPAEIPLPTDQPQAPVHVEVEPKLNVF